MKTFEWIDVEHRGKEINHSVSLIEPLENGFIFWASINVTTNNENKYEFVAFNKSRELFSTAPLDTVEEAKLAVLEFLFDEGVIEEGDEIEQEEP